MRWPGWSRSYPGRRRRSCRRSGRRSTVVAADRRRTRPARAPSPRTDPPALDSRHGLSVDGGEVLELARVDRADVVRAHQADVGAVILVLDVARRQGGVLLGHDAVGEGAEGNRDRLAEAGHLSLILGLARQVLLAKAVPGLGVRLHDDAGLGAGFAGVPGARRADRRTGVGLGVLAEVPDVSGRVL